ncbi:MAG: hypothetical protein ACQEP7_03235 [bacterium]
MKKLIAIFTVVFIVFWALPGQARYVGFSDHTEPGLKFSAYYDYNNGDYEPDAGGDELELTSQLAGARVDLNVFEKIQIHGIIGNSTVDFADSEPEDGSVYGGGVQYLLEPAAPYYLKLTGSLLNHEAREYAGTGAEFEFTTDWQAGVILGQKYKQTFNRNKPEFFDTYLGAIYTTRKLESGVHGGEYELKDLSGAQLVAGVNYSFTDFLLIEGEGRLGAENGIGGRLVYQWK